VRERRQFLTNLAREAWGSVRCKNEVADPSGRVQNVALEPSEEKMTRGRSFARAVLAVAILLTCLVASSRSAWAVGEEKAGPFMANLKIGPAIDLDAPPGVTQFALELEAGIALDHAKNAYLTFTPQFEFGDLCTGIGRFGCGGRGSITTIIIPIGFQYDIEMPVKHLYIYPKIDLGLGIFTGGAVGAGTQGAFVLQPAFGIKYQLLKNLHIGGEPFSLPFFLGNKYDGFGAQYQIYLYAGIDL